MYAVIKVAGKQHRVSTGQYVLVDQPEAQDVAVEVLMFVDGTTVLTGADAAKAKIGFSKAGTVKITGNRSMKFKPKQHRSCKRILGYRRTVTKVMIDSLSAS